MRFWAYTLQWLESYRMQKIGLPAEPQLNKDELFRSEQTWEIFAKTYLRHSIHYSVLHHEHRVLHSNNNVT
jgi:hypothetical protein